MFHWKPRRDADRSYLLKLQQRGICVSHAWRQALDHLRANAWFLSDSPRHIRRLKLSQGHKTFQAHGSESIRLSFPGNIPAAGSHKEALFCFRAALSWDGTRWDVSCKAPCAVNFNHSSDLTLLVYNFAWLKKKHACINK